MVQFRLLLKPFAEVLKSSLTHSASSPLILTLNWSANPCCSQQDAQNGHLHYLKVPMKSNSLPDTLPRCRLLSYTFIQYVSFGENFHENKARDNKERRIISVCNFKLLHKKMTFWFSSWEYFGASYRRKAARCMHLKICVLGARNEMNWSIRECKINRLKEILRIMV